MTSETTFYFAGVDPAPSEGNRSDEGGKVILRARLREGLLASEHRDDYVRDYVFARRYTHKEKLSARRWSGSLHEDHQEFRLSGICMDPNGGGQFVRRELAMNRQLIRGAETDCRPIVTPDTLEVSAEFILYLFKRGDPGIEALWPGLAGDDQLNDYLYSEFKQDLDTAGIGLPKPYHEWTKEELMGWSEARVWALKNLNSTGLMRRGSLTEQLANIMVATKEDGTWAFTRRNARQFASKGKKDMVSSAMYANLAFLIWLKLHGSAVSVAPEDAGAFACRAN